MSNTGTPPDKAVNSNGDKNPANIQTADFARHGKLKLKPNPGFPHAKDRNVVAINVSELGIASSNFPIVFLQNPTDKRYVLMAMLGLMNGENIYYGPDFWDTSYVPMAIQRHPFIIGIDERVGGGQLATCLEMDSTWLGEKEGLPLFNADGSESEVLRTATQMLSNMFDAGAFTERFVNRLVELNLIVPLEIDLQGQKGGLHKVTGLNTIDEKRLKELSAEELKDLQMRDFLAPCHLMLVSLYQINHMVRRRNRMGAEQITNFRLEFPNEKAAKA